MNYYYYSLYSKFLFECSTLLLCFIYLKILWFFRKLEENWKVIRDEGVAILNQATGGFEVEDENLREKGDWRQFTLYSRGMKHTKSCKKTPQTCAIVDTIPDATGCRRGQVRSTNT